MTYAIVMTTCDDRALAKSIAGTLVEKRLAACVQIMPIDSIYTWQGKVEEAAELLRMLFALRKRIQSDCDAKRELRAV